MRKQFKLLMIKPLEGCEDYISKILKIGEPYFFYNNYKEDKDWITRKEESLSIDFFTTNEKSSTNISISAIVGKNGEGKSSIIELLIRVLNNFCKVYRFSGDSNNLIYIRGVRAELFFSVSDFVNNELQKEIVYKIKISDGDSTYTDKIELFRDNTETPLWIETFNIVNNFIKGSNNGATSEQMAEESFIKDFFFSLVSNYSLYAYNPADYNKESEWVQEYDSDKPLNQVPGEEKNWLNSVFHKNDGYQTPIVLHPYRVEGNINVNTEHTLTKQRMISLFLNDDEEESKDSIRWVNEKQFAREIDYILHKESIIDSQAIREYFRNTLNNNYDKETRSIINDEKTLKYTERIYASLVNTYTKHKTLFDNALTLLREVSHEQIIARADFNIVKTDMSNLIDFLQRNLKNTPPQSAEINNIKKLNFIQFYRLELIGLCINKWRSIFYNRGINIDECILLLNEKGGQLGQLAFDYLVYKTLLILQRYPQYEYMKSYPNILGYVGSIVNTKYGQNYAHNFINGAIDDLLEDDSHITLKLRQTLNLLGYNINIHKQYNLSLYKQYLALFDLETRIIDVVIDLRDKSGRVIGKTKVEEVRYCRSTNLSTYYQKLQNVCINSEGKFVQDWVIDFLPPPIFQTEVLLYENEKVSTLSRMSSGELQLWMSTSAILYHLRNLNSVIAIPKVEKNFEDTSIYQFQHVLLILEEIELYFHPEYQRKYIDFIIDKLQKMNLNEIESINICIATHSPFILSDIPNSNIMYLEKGKQMIDNINIEPFGANIHDILRQSFFLDKGFIGEFTQKKISLILDGMNKVKKECNTDEPLRLEHEQYKKYVAIAELIGEPLIKNKLKMMLNEFTENSQQTKLEEDIALLKKELKEKEDKLTKLGNDVEA